jgi:hypothetical protein
MLRSCGMKQTLSGLQLVHGNMASCGTEHYSLICLGFFFVGFRSKSCSVNITVSTPHVSLRGADLDFCLQEELGKGV